MAVTIGICTSARQANIEKFLSTLMSLHLPLINFKMVELPYNDLDSYRVEQQGLDGLILCHSIHNRRFAITDVMDALYDTFLPRARRFIGKKNVGVIVHDFDWPYRQGWKSSTMDTFQKKQPMAVACSSLQILCGKLDNSVEMDEDDWNKLLEYPSAVQPLSNFEIVFESCRIIFETVSRLVKITISFFVGRNHVYQQRCLYLLRGRGGQINKTLRGSGKSAMSIVVYVFKICRKIFETVSPWVKPATNLAVYVFKICRKIFETVFLLVKSARSLVVYVFEICRKIFGTVFLWVKSARSLVVYVFEICRKIFETVSLRVKPAMIPVACVFEWCWPIFKTVLGCVMCAIISLVKGLRDLVKLLQYFKLVNHRRSRRR